MLADDIDTLHLENVRVEIVEVGHLMGGELPEESNRRILDFFGRS